MPEAASRRLWSVLVVALFCAPIFVELGAGDLQTDEAIYSFAVDRILETGGWLVPASSPQEDVPFLEKPPLKFWIVALPIRLGLLPHDEFGLRFWDAVFGGVAFVYVVVIGRRLAHPICGAVAVLILFLHDPLLVEHGLRSNNMEAALLLSYCGGVYHSLAWAAEDRPLRRPLHAGAVALMFVLGFMTKFVAAIFLPLVLAVSIALVPACRAHVARHWRMWLGAGLLAVALIVPWFFYAWLRFGRSTWRIMFGEHVYTRFTAYLDETHLNPWHYYFSTAYIELSQTHGALPYIVALGLVLLAVRTVRHRSLECIVVVLWFVLPLALMSWGSSKLYHYAYPFLPPLALAGGYVAALLVEAARSPADRLATIADRNLSRFSRQLPDVIRRPAVTRLLLICAVLAGLVSAATAMFGPMRARVGESLVLRNSSVWRPALTAVGLTVLTNRLPLLIRVAPSLVVFVGLPAGEYRQTLAELRAAPSPLRSIRDCVLRVRSESREALPPAALYVEAEDRLYHPVNYYLRRLRPWERPGQLSDARLYDRLYGANRGPALVAGDRYDEFNARLRKGDPALVGNVDSGSVRARAREAEPLIYRYADVLVLLPGRYAECYPGVR